MSEGVVPEVGQCSPPSSASPVLHKVLTTTHQTPKRRKLVPIRDHFALLSRGGMTSTVPRVGVTAPGLASGPSGASSCSAMQSSALSVSAPMPASMLLASGGSTRRARCSLEHIDPSYTAMSGLCAASDVGTPRGGSIRIQHVTAGAAAAASSSSLPGLQGGSGPPSLASAGPCPDGDAPVRFPRLDECAHFHYDHVELGPLQVRLYEEELKALQEDSSEGGEGDDSPPLCVQVTSAGRAWLLRRAPRDFRSLDAQLHRCVWDRKFSALPDLSMALQPTQQESSEECARRVLSAYLCRFSSLAGSLINCGPVLSWLELDNRGRRLIVTEDNAINTPAVAAAYAVRRYVAQAADEISFEVGDMISVIDMPPPQESIWWRGKRGFEVGFFPCDTVAVIGDKVPKNLHLSAAPSAPPSGTVCGSGGSSAVVAAPLSMAAVTSASHLPNKPVLRKHGKLIAFFRSFILNRPSRRRLKQSGILKERVFGCDLGEHLLNSGHEIPMVLKCCSEFIESSGIVDGIYRLSGVTSNIQKLRNAFDEDRIPALYEDESILQDIHSVASLLKMYFRELPNPLCTYQLYPSFVAAVQARENERLIKMREAVQKLPPPHYRTLEYLIRHLARVASRGHETGMTPRNVAIVWAPNLLRCKELEVGGLGALQGVGVQAVVTEFLVCCCELIFCDSLPAETDTPAISEQAVSTLRRGGARPKSLAISTPTKLLSLEEARSRALGQPGQEFIEVVGTGGGPSQLPGKYHTVIELPSGRKRGSSLKAKRSPLGWRSLFGGGGKARPASKQRKSSTPTDMEQSALQSEVLQPRRPLRPVKSAESLGSSGGGSQHNSARNSAALELDSLSPGAMGVAQTSPESPCSVAGPLPCISLHTSFLTVKPSHNRSVSHDSYFDLLSSSQRGDDDDDDITEEGSLDLSEIQLNFELEESEMRIFSEDETLVSTSSPATSNHSVLSHQAGRHKPSPRNVPRARMEELSMSSADPSPKKNKKSSTNSPGSRKRSRTITPHSVKVDELRFIDSQSPEPNTGTIMTSAEVHESPPSDISVVCATVSENESFALPRSSGSSGLTTPGSPPRYAPLLSEQTSPLTAATTPATTGPSDTGTSLEGLYENIASGDWEQITPGTNLLYQNVMPVSPKSLQEENVYEDVQPPSTRSAKPQGSTPSETPAVDPEEVYQQVRAFRRSVAEVNDLMFRSGGMPSSPSNCQHETELRKSWSPALAPQDSEELRRRFDSEIGRDIVRERRMKTELARVRADSTPTSPTQSPAHDRASSSQLSPPSSMACVTSEGVTEGDLSPLATTAAPLLPSSEGSLTSLSSASFDPLSPSPPLHHNLSNLSKPQLGTSPSPLSLSSPSPGSSRNSPSKRSSSIGSPEKVTCNLINLESQSPKYRLSDSNFSSQQISPDSDSSERNKRHSFNPHILEKVTCSLVNIETRSSPKYLVSSGNMSSSQISSIDSESSNLDSLSPTTQDSEITLLSPMMSPIKETMKLMLSPILSSEEFSESPEFSSQRIQAPSTLNISKPVSPDEDTSLDLSRLQESPTVTDSLRDTPTSFTCSPDLPLTPSLSIRPGPPSRPLTPLLSSPDQRSVSTKSSPISPEPPTPLSNRSPTFQLQDSSPKSETLPNLWDENSSETLSAKSTEPKSSESPLENEEEDDDDDDVELRDPSGETSRPKSAPSKASTVRVHVTLTSRRSSEPIKTLSLADARRLGNRKASVKELLNQFESGSPQQKSMPPCLRAKVAKHQLASAMSGSLDEERFNEHARDLVRVRTSPDVTKQEDDNNENNKIELEPDSKHDDDIPKVNIAKNLLSDVNLNDPIRRERIEKYKEERRNFLREKYRSESFRVDKQKDDIVSRLKQKTNKAGGSSSTSENSDTMISHSMSDNERLNEGIRSRSQSESSSRPKLKQPTSPTHSLKDNMGALFETNENQKPKSPEYFSSV